jgi:hypothetical protein
VAFLKTALVRSWHASGAVALAVALGWGGIAAAAAPTGPQAASAAVSDLSAPAVTDTVRCAFCWD